MKRSVYLAAAVMLLASVPSLAEEGVVALQTADPSCRTTTTPPPIYVGCGNGTVTDNRTGLVWLQNASCWRDAATGDAVLNWHEATEIVANLSDIPPGSPGMSEADDCGLSDGSSPGEWRLPSVAEWEVMIADAVALGCVQGNLGGPSITNNFGDLCWQEGPRNSFSGVVSSGYWSSTTLSSDASSAWGAGLASGGVGLGDKTLSFYVWPVRGGQ